MNECYIALGSNLSNSLGTPFEILRSGLTEINKHPSLKVLLCSSCYQSKPHGPQDQEDFFNAVAKVKSTEQPAQLLNILQSIENLHERDRQKYQYWGPRTLDLDILLFDNELISDQQLTIPHLFLEEREFVLLPLYEIAPTLILPNGKKLKSLAENFAENGIIKLKQQLWSIK
jgi:2-amino-4-hydroxy-6-hydroxymethyldihydropteridine diphosphokinase